MHPGYFFTKEGEKMRGATTMYADDRKEILRLYKTVSERTRQDAGSIQGLRDANPELVSEFDTIDAAPAA